MKRGKHSFAAMVANRWKDNNRTVKSKQLKRKANLLHIIQPGKEENGKKKAT